MSEKQSSLMRSLGLVTGDLWSLVSGRPRKAKASTVVRRDVQSKVIETPHGPMTLQRTTTDEVILPERPRSR